MTKHFESLSFDQLGILPEDDVANRLRSCRTALDGAASPSVRAHIEYEHAKVQRELTIRQERRKLHQEYLSKLAAEDAAELLREATLPEYEGNRIPSFIRETWTKDTWTRRS